jgi:hypothetical protein
MWIRGSFLGLTVLDREGNPVGQIEETYPYDGSSPEFAILRLGRFGGRALVSLHAARRLFGVVQVPYSLPDMEAAPTLDGGRYMDDQIWAARAYWGTYRPEYGIDYDRVAASRDA